MWRITRRPGGSNRYGVTVVEMVEAGTVEVVGGCFSSLPLPCPELEDPHPAINNLYNMCINQ